MSKNHIVIVANTAWSIFNFRHGLLERLLNDGYRISVVAPNDKFSVKLKDMGCDVSDLPMEGANKRGNSSRLTQSFHFFMFEPIFSPVNALNQPI
ncbi:hypothetical protein [Aeromonas caviae]|uniref:hypothetical protein n=1 Tax=Aeromonas caviae TaxID=648 RepID=UPI00191FF26A|nr:hypothetical protein [Aeromonas caviae]MBL0652716.1 hypothetical protein [Aeromonas caviae]